MSEEIKTTPQRDYKEYTVVCPVLKVLARHLGIAQRERTANPDSQYAFGVLREVEEIIAQIGAKGLEPMR
jgi:hypothetical protein